jgi:hypothetical protein
MTDFGLVKRLSIEGTDVFGVISLAKSAKQNKAEPKAKEDTKEAVQVPPPDYLLYIAFNSEHLHTWPLCVCVCALSYT